MPSLSSMQSAVLDLDRSLRIFDGLAYDWLPDAGSLSEELHLGLREFHLSCKQPKL